MIELHQFDVGEWRCTAVNDGGNAGNASMLFANAPAEELAAALARHGETADSIPSTWTCLLLQNDTQAVLIDTGVGEGNAPDGGRLLAGLQQVGVAPADIDVVFLTHVHGDHILGAIQPDGQLTFPNARYRMGQKEWAFWTNKKTLKTAPSWAANTARRVLPSLAGVIETVADGEMIVPGIRALAAYGHTVGHMAVEITSGDERLLHLADTALHPIHLEHPDWMAVVDQRPAQAVATRRRLFVQAAADEVLVLAFHFRPFPSLGHVESHGDTWRWQPLAQNLA